ncbi:hypothetical protein KW787_02785, partial [Candidatus Pacearchaeota archaeon]|nr:hypothetical protein [Candidatus Pacearchaeota archaeon]
LYQLVNAIKDISILLSPFIPETAEKIAKDIKFEISLNSLEKPLPPGKIKKGHILFNKVETMAKKPEKSKKEDKKGKNTFKKVEKAVVKETRKLAGEAKDTFMKVEQKVEDVAKRVTKNVSQTVSHAVESAKKAMEGKPASQHHNHPQAISHGIVGSDGKIAFKEFSKVDLRVGKITDVKDHPNADKLYVLTINTGEGKPRTIVAGLKEHYTKEELKGKKVIVVVNLSHANLRGVQSEGMLLAAVSNDESEVVFLAPESDIKEGSKVR